MVRILLVPVFMVSYSLNWLGGYCAMGIFILAGFTDMLDGYIARHYNQVSNFGKFVDPLADKLINTAAILVLLEKGILPSWCAMIFIGRDFAVTGMRLLVQEGAGKVVAARFSGKFRTAFSTVVIIYLITPFRSLLWQGIPGAEMVVQTTLVYLLAIVSVVTCVDYFVKDWDSMKF
jgi:CDP-diacylglycerol--glycerol-3-phosphate 3-phosphatidyltransferase